MGRGTVESELDSGVARGSSLGGAKLCLLGKLIDICSADWDWDARGGRCRVEVDVVNFRASSSSIRVRSSSSARMERTSSTISGGSNARARSLPFEFGWAVWGGGRPRPIDCEVDATRSFAGRLVSGAGRAGGGFIDEVAAFCVD